MDIPALQKADPDMIQDGIFNLPGPGQCRLRPHRPGNSAAAPADPV